MAPGPYYHWCLAAHILLSILPPIFAQNTTTTTTTTTSSSSSDKVPWWAILILCILGFIILVLLIALVCVRRRSRSRQGATTATGSGHYGGSAPSSRHTTPTPSTHQMPNAAAHSAQQQTTAASCAIPIDGTTTNASNTDGFVTPRDSTHDLPATPTTQPQVRTYHTANGPVTIRTQNLLPQLPSPPMSPTTLARRMSAGTQTMPYPALPPPAASLRSGSPATTSSCTPSSATPTNASGGGWWWSWLGWMSGNSGGTAGGADHSFEHAPGPQTPYPSEEIRPVDGHAIIQHGVSARELHGVSIEMKPKGKESPSPRSRAAMAVNTSYGSPSPMKTTSSAMLPRTESHPPVPPASILPEGPPAFDQDDNLLTTTTTAPISRDGASLTRRESGPSLIPQSGSTVRRTGSIGGGGAGAGKPSVTISVPPGADGKQLIARPASPIEVGQTGQPDNFLRDVDSTPTAEERDLITQMRAVLPQDAKDNSKNRYTIFGQVEVYGTEFFLRHLRARDFDLAKSSALMLGYVNWRSVSYPKGVHPSEIPEELRSGQYYSEYRDKQGRPVVIVRARYHDKNRPLELTLKTMICCLDAAVHHCKVGGVSQFAAIADLDKFTTANWDLPALKQGLHMLDNYYPERLGNIWFLHSSFLFNTLWKIIKPFIPKRTAEKILFFGSDFRDQLVERIDASVLPMAYGGTAPDPGVPFIGRLGPPGSEEV